MHISWVDAILRSRGCNREGMLPQFQTPRTLRPIGDPYYMISLQGGSVWSKFEGDSCLLLDPQRSSEEQIHSPAPLFVCHGCQIQKNSHLQFIIAVPKQSSASFLGIEIIDHPTQKKNVLKVPLRVFGEPEEGEDT